MRWGFGKGSRCRSPGGIPASAPPPLTERARIPKPSGSMREGQTQVAASDSERRSGRRAPDWARDTRPPVPLPPAGSCDCQFHIFGDPVRYPLRFDTGFVPPSATFADIRKVLGTMGFSRGVIVHTRRYDTDHSLLIDELRALPPSERRNFRAIGTVRDDLTDAQMAELDAIGVCGARFNLGKRYGQVHEPAAVRRTMDRLREIGWHARLHVTGADIPDWADFLLGIKDLPLVIDHMGHLDFSLGLEQPVLRWILDRLMQGSNWWVKLSNGNRDSAQETGWDDAIPFARAFIAAAPERMIWGTDWPHTGWRKARMMNDAELVELLYRYVDNDPTLLRRILVDNPARLHGFEA
jgi:2-pyrone-4,6-dicarboxylate lactonase